MRRCWLKELAESTSTVRQDLKLVATARRCTTLFNRANGPAGELSNLVMNALVQRMEAASKAFLDEHGNRRPHANLRCTVRIKKALQDMVSGLSEADKARLDAAFFTYFTLARADDIQAVTEGESTQLFSGLEGQEQETPFLSLFRRRISHCRSLADALKINTRFF